MTISIKLLDPEWIASMEDSPSDPCAHGTIEVLLNGKLMFDYKQEYFCITTAALYLLRTLDRNHTEINPVNDGGPLLPCCSNLVFAEKNQRPPFSVLDCGSGVDFEVVHNQHKISIIEGHTLVSIPLQQWKQVVCTFASDVINFYKDSPPKQPTGDISEQRGWKLLWEEYHQNLDRHSKWLQP